MTNWTLRDYQLDAFNDASGNSRLIINMPTGWGKSFLLSALGAADVADTDRKLLICVPQKIIAKGFRKRKQISLPDGSKVTWSVFRDLCGTSTAKVDELVAFLLEKKLRSPNRSIVITTHMTLAYALNRIPDEQLLDVAKRLTLCVDEAHHILASEFERNVLGNEVARLLTLDPKGFKLWLATAFFFRGDHLPIISDSQLAEFTKVHIPFDEYWKTLKYIRSYSYDFVAFKGTLFKELEHVLRKDTSAPTIIYCPPEGHKMLLGKSKAKFVSRIERITCRCLTAIRWQDHRSVLDRRPVVIDLVDTEGRTEKLQFIAEHGDQVAAILTVGMFREGADWVEAQRIVDMVPTNSDQDRLQRFGRLVRDNPGKSHISYVSLFPFVVDLSEEDRRRQFTKCYAHFHASLVLENAIHPIKVQLQPKPKHRNERRPVDADRLVACNLLGEFSEAKQEAIIRDCYEGLLNLQQQKESQNSTPTPEEARKAIEEVLRNNGVDKHVVPLAKQVLLLMRRKANVSLKTDDLVDAGFDKVWSSEVFKPLLAYSAELGGPETLSEIRKVVENLFDAQWQQHFEQVRTLPGPPDTQSSAYWWCTNNRTLCANGRLPESRLKLLETIPWWTWTLSVEDRWHDNYQTVRGLSSCPKAGTTEYSWVRQQRRRYHDGKLSEEQVKELESLPWWKWADLEKNWLSKFEELSSNQEKPERGSRLYEWIRTQRKSYKTGKLSVERIQKLESLPDWQWVERRSDCTEGLKELEICIREGISLNHCKSQVAEQWAAVIGVGADQVHKYLRRSKPKVRSGWDQLTDNRVRRPIEEPQKCRKSRQDKVAGRTRK